MWPKSVSEKYWTSIYPIIPSPPFFMISVFFLPFFLFSLFSYLILILYNIFKHFASIFWIFYKKTVQHITFNIKSVALIIFNTNATPSVPSIRLLHKHIPFYSIHLFIILIFRNSSSRIIAYLEIDSIAIHRQLPLTAAFFLFHASLSVKWFISICQKNMDVPNLSIYSHNLHFSNSCLGNHKTSL